MRHLTALLVLCTLVGCYSMETQRVLVLDSNSKAPVAGVRVYKKPVGGLHEAFNPIPRLRPLPRAAEGVSDHNGLLSLRVPRNHRTFMYYVGSEDYEGDAWADVQTATTKPATRPAGVDAIYYVRRRQTLNSPE